MIIQCKQTMVFSCWYWNAVRINILKTEKMFSTRLTRTWKTIKPFSTLQHHDCNTELNNSLKLLMVHRAVKVQPKADLHDLYSGFRYIFHIRVGWESLLSSHLNQKITPVKSQMNLNSILLNREYIHLIMKSEKISFSYH